MGPSAAGCGRSAYPNVAIVTVNGIGTASFSGTGVAPDGVMAGSEIQTGFNVVGVSRSNHGPNVAGAPKTLKDLTTAFGS